MEEQHGFELNLEPSRVRVELNANEQALCPEARCGSVERILECRGGVALNPLGLGPNP